jgi:hypothetical protein
MNCRYECPILPIPIIGFSFLVYSAKGKKERDHAMHSKKPRKKPTLAQDFWSGKTPCWEMTRCPEPIHSGSHLAVPKSLCSRLLFNQPRWIGNNPLQYLWLKGCQKGFDKKLILISIGYTVVIVVHRNIIEH